MPEMFGRYELHDLLGRGGMGEVYRATDTVRDRTVALKLLPKHLAADESFKTRFRRESRMAARLNDPHIIPIHDFGEIDGQLFIDMRLVEGRDLGSILTDRGSLPAPISVKIISQTASALEAAHQSGLVHRDVKPSNVLLAGWTDTSDVGDIDPFAYLVDFGIARSANQEGTALTATSGTVGTVAYMSPERIGGSPGDRRTDIYALGCVLYETIAGRKPFDGEIFAIMYAHMNTPPPRLTDVAHDAPAALNEVIFKALAKEPDERYATASEFALAARQALRAAPAPVSSPAPSQPPAPPTAPPAGPPTGPPPAPHPSAPVPQYSTPTYTEPHPPQQPAAPHPSAPLPPQHERPAASVAPPVGPPPGPVRPASPSQPVRPPVGQPNVAPGPPPSAPPQSHPQWAPPPTGPTGPPSTHPSGPIRPPTLPVPARSGGRRKGLLIGGGVAAVAAAVVAVVLAVSGGGNSPQGQPSNSGSSSGSVSSGAPVQSASYRTGVPSTPPVSWDHFGSYSKLVGTKDGDTANAYQDGNCRLSGIGADDPEGLLDQIQCTYQGSPVTADIARFQNPDQVQTYLRFVTRHGYAISAFKIGDRVVGLRFVSPDTEDNVDVITYMCGLPHYLVQFYATDKSAASASSILDNYWSGSTFPDLVPQECTTSFTGVEPGSPPTMDGFGALKDVTSLETTRLESYVRRDHPEWDVAAVEVATGTEMIVAPQEKQVAFWSWNKDAQTLTFQGFSTYPYDPKKLGQPQATARGTLLSGMDHATFIVTGQFSTDGSGNAVAYTYSDTKGWGAIKAQPNGNLAPSGQGVAIKGIGLSQDFDFVDGLLETADCSRNLPVSDCTGDNRVLKYWSWEGAQFVLDHTAGRSS